MEKTVVISVRLPESLLRKLKEIQEDHCYYKRNAIIERALTAFAFAADHGEQAKVLSWWRHSSRKASLKFDVADISF